ncbi:MAG: 2-aminoethylphosphonate--pyruvate transaminase [Candidatus Latescibacteria bacterium]|nr:2-aminoethylphosphonate--pyruvate transaminase [Candidatus Latescibacterota bacterium]
MNRQNPYLLLTPGPLSTTETVKETMLLDWCTWDDDYNSIVEGIRRDLVRLATVATDYTAVLMQGSGTFGVEATIGTALPADGKLLVLVNGAYGERIAEIARRLKIDLVVESSGEIEPPDLAAVRHILEKTPDITHLAVVHCETTTGMLNPVEDILRLAKEFDVTTILDAMSSFGGIPMDAAGLQADFLISSANKCIQGVPGFSFVLARRSALEACQGRARSLSLDLYSQWREMEEKGGKWRYTSPTHVVRAFAQALQELAVEGGVEKRHARYRENARILVEGMEELGFSCLLPPGLRSPIITAFVNPPQETYDFRRFYAALKERGFVIYPGKVSSADTFRIGHIGDVAPADVERLVQAVRESIFWV